MDSDDLHSDAELVDRIVKLSVSPPSLYNDLEGIKLSRHGFISIVTLYVLPTATVYLIDVHVLGIAAFFTTGKSKQTLQAILESEKIPKVFFRRPQRLGRTSLLLSSQASWHY